VTWIADMWHNSHVSTHMSHNDNVHALRMSRIGHVAYVPRGKRHISLGELVWDDFTPPAPNKKKF